jgi:hypothetical protein
VELWLVTNLDKGEAERVCQGSCCTISMYNEALRYVIISGPKSEIKSIRQKIWRLKVRKGQMAEKDYQKLKEQLEKSLN